jgi:hypothetical protein
MTNGKLAAYAEGYGVPRGLPAKPEPLRRLDAEETRIEDGGSRMEKAARGEVLRAILYLPTTR